MTKILLGIIIFNLGFVAHMLWQRFWGDPDE